MPTVAEGVTIGTVDVGGMNALQAEAAVKAAYDRPLRFVFRNKRWRATPAQLGAKPALQPAIGRALGAAPGQAIELKVKVKGNRVRKYVATLDQSFRRPAVNSEVKLFKRKPKLTKSKEGVVVERLDMTKAILAVLSGFDRAPVELAHRLVEPQVTENDKRPTVVVRRGSRTLYFYKGKKLVRQFQVAVGQTAYPTPLGRFDIVTKQVDPTWIPPNSTWAQGLEPVGPGYGNPLGTRWMGLSSPLIGIHGTYASYSLGTAASHGCIRMSVSESEWLFSKVEVGTPIWIIEA